MSLRRRGRSAPLATISGTAASAHTRDASPLVHRRPRFSRAIRKHTIGAGGLECFPCADHCPRWTYRLSSAGLTEKDKLGMFFRGHPVSIHESTKGLNKAALESQAAVSQMPIFRIGHLLLVVRRYFGGSTKQLPHSSEDLNCFLTQTNDILTSWHHEEYKTKECISLASATQQPREK